jgi:putative ABC transport system substrate-binding protein
MNNRRRLVIALAGSVSIPRSVFAQAKKPPIVIGWLAPGLGEQGGRGGRLRDTFKSELAALGWRTGSQVVIEERFADGHTERLPALAAELVIKKPALIVAVSTASAQAAVKAAPQTPIVAFAGDLVSAGLADGVRVGTQYEDRQGAQSRHPARVRRARGPVHSVTNATGGSGSIVRLRQRQL